MLKERFCHKQQSLKIQVKVKYLTIQSWKMLNFQVARKNDPVGTEEKTHQNNIARILIGTSFSWWDMLMYTLGILFVVVLESYDFKKK